MKGTHLHGLDVEEKLMNYKVTDPETGCWRWTRGVNRWGYAMIRVAKGNKVRAARMAHMLWVGPIPAGLHIDHVYERGCRHRDCINPAHLEAVTQAENNRRGQGFGGRNARKTHCVHGHEFTAENTYNTPNGRRRCRECARIWQRKFKAARRAERETSRVYLRCDQPPPSLPAEEGT